MNPGDRLRAWGAMETGVRRLAIDYLVSAGWDFEDGAFVLDGKRFFTVDEACDCQRERDMKPKVKEGR